MPHTTTHGLSRLLQLFAGAGAISCAALSAPAATTEGLFAARGIGAQVCDSISDTDEESRDASVAALSTWIAGYLSHANRVTPDRFEVTPVVDNRVLAAIVVQLCTQNPAALIENVFASVLDLTAAGGQPTESDLIELRNGDAVTTLRAAALAEVQQALASLDLLAQADIDGAYGPRTRNALTAFQEQRSLAPTGVPDPVTLLNLFSPR